MATNLSPMPGAMLLRPASEGGYTVWTDGRSDYGEPGRLLYAGTLHEALGFMRDRCERPPEQAGTQVKTWCAPAGIDREA